MAAAASRIALNVPIRLIANDALVVGERLRASLPTMRLAVPIPAQLTRMRAGP